MSTTVVHGFITRGSPVDNEETPTTGENMGQVAITRVDMHCQAPETVSAEEWDVVRRSVDYFRSIS